MGLKEQIENNLIVVLCATFSAGVALGWTVCHNVFVTPRSEEIERLKDRLEDSEATNGDEAKSFETVLPRGTLLDWGDFYEIPLASCRMELGSMGSNRNGFVADVQFTSDVTPSPVQSGLGAVSLRKGDWHDLTTQTAVIRIRVLDIHFTDGEDDQVFTFSVEQRPRW